MIDTYMILIDTYKFFTSLLIIANIIALGNNNCHFMVVESDLNMLDTV